MNIAGNKVKIESRLRHFSSLQGSFLIFLKQTLLPVLRKGDITREQFEIIRPDLERRKKHDRMICTIFFVLFFAEGGERFSKL